MIKKIIVAVVVLIFVGFILIFFASRVVCQKYQFGFGPAGKLVKRPKPYSEVTPRTILSYDVKKIDGQEFFQHIEKREKTEIDFNNGFSVTLEPKDEWKFTEEIFDKAIPEEKNLFVTVRKKDGTYISMDFADFDGQKQLGFVVFMNSIDGKAFYLEPAARYKDDAPLDEFISYSSADTIHQDVHGFSKQEYIFDVCTLKNIPIFE